MRSEHRDTNMKMAIPSVAIIRFPHCSIRFPIPADRICSTRLEIHCPIPKILGFVDVFEIYGHMHDISRNLDPKRVMESPNRAGIHVDYVDRRRRLESFDDAVKASA